MKIYDEFRSGLKAYISSYEVMKKHKLWRYLVIPGIISISYAGLYWYMASGMKSRMLEEVVDSWEWWKNFVTWFVENAFWPFVIWFFFATYKIFIFALTSPVLSNLSEVVERMEHGALAPKTTFRDSLSDIERSIRLSIRNMGYELVICFFLGLIPYANIVLVFVVGSYYSGFGYMDYTLERKRLNLEQSVKFMQDHKGMSTSIGIPFQLGMLVPFAGWVIMPVFSTIAATLVVSKEIPYRREDDEDWEEQQQAAAGV